jgi:catechol 2,3-dioxygenase-like lactoylglutathione lyase family enzyme
MSTRRPRITGLSHVALFARDICRSRAFYKRFLGFAEPCSLGDRDGQLQLTWIKINDRQTIELFPERAANSDRLHHVALETDDLEQMRQYFVSRDVPISDEVPKGRIGSLSFMIRDPNGHAIEFVQHDADGMAAPERGKFMPETRIADRMSHAGILVGSLARSLRFYCDILGFGETWRGSRDGQKLSWVNVKLPDGNDYLELMLYEQLPDADKRHTAHHICLEVPSVPQAEQVLRERTLPEGCKSPTPLRIGINGKRQLNCYDPDGSRVELMEPQPAEGQPVAPSQAAPPIA